MNNPRKPSIGFIGLGRVGTNLGIIWDNLGYNISCVYSKNLESGQKFVELVSTHIATTFQEVIDRCDIVFLTVPDNAIEEVAQALNMLESLDTSYFVHTSGAHTLQSLAILRHKSRGIGSIHPAYPFAHRNDNTLNLSNVTFAIEASNIEIENHLKQLVLDTKGNPIVLTSDKKRLYHAAMVFTSNYTVTLYSIGISLLKSLEIDDAIAANTLNQLLKSTVNNLDSLGLPEALTGPLVRNDTRTIKAHLETLNKVDTNLANLYIQLSRATYPLLEAQNINIQLVESIFKSFES